MEETMKFSITIFTVTLLLSFGSAFSQVEKGDVRIGLGFDFSSAKDNTNAEFDLGLGYSFTDNIEPGVVLSVIKEEGHDTHGKIGGDFLFHFAPAKKVVPGLGVAMGRTFGLDHHNATIYELFFNVDAFATPVWSINLKTGYERHSEEHHNEGSFFIRVGIATFLKPAHHESTGH
jgi:hypothetical protein